MPWRAPLPLAELQSAPGRRDFLAGDPQHQPAARPVRYRQVQQFFQNCLQCDEHPFFEEIAGLQVSAHFLIERDGAITQFVSCLDRAWHAGVSCFDGREGCNDFSIGIELEGTDHEPFSEAQYRALIELCRLLQCAYPAITPERVCGHSDIAPGRKTDPGPAFDWLRLRAASITC